MRTEKKKLTLHISQQLGITLSEANYFVSTPSIEKNMYDPADDSIDIIYKDGTIKKYCRSIGHAEHLIIVQKGKEILSLLSEITQISIKYSCNNTEI